MPTQRKYAFFALITVSVCILALYIHRHRQGQTGRVDNILIGTAGGVQKHFFYMGQGLQSLVDGYFFLVDAKKTAENLQKQNDELQAKLTSMQDVQLENTRLRDALQFKTTITLPLLAAHVVAHDVSSDYLGIRIDRGEVDGIRAGMGVIAPGGVVGRVLRVTANYSDVLALADPTSNVDVLIQRSRARGILSGQAKQLTCKLKYIDRLDDVQVEDTLVTTGFENVFPAGLLVGHVTAVIPNSNGILQTVTVKTAVNIYRLEEVFVVLPPAESKKTAE